LTDKLVLIGTWAMSSGPSIVQPTNNQADQSLSNMVVFRKICFGTRSTDGSDSHSVLPSLLLTAKRQGKHPPAFFQTVFTSDTPTAQAALYNNSS